MTFILNSLQLQTNYFLLPLSSLGSSPSLDSNQYANYALKLSTPLSFSSDLTRARRRSSWRCCVRAFNDSFSPSNGERPSDNGVRTLRGLIGSLQPSVSVVQKNVGSPSAIGLYIAFAFSAIVVRQIMLKGRSHNRQGSVAELVRRGQLRPDRRGISQPLKYEDPFDNPLVKVNKTDSTIQMCGKIYRLAPITLTEEQQYLHQKRRSRAYQWKKPTVFLKEGDSIPADVDPETVRWVPTNHPFATTVSDIDEEMAQNNISQKHGVPSRIKAEHEALRKKLEAIQNEQKLKEDAINPNGAQSSEESEESVRLSSLKTHEEADPSTAKG